RAERQLEQFARGERGTLRIGMECHPCYQWLLKIAAPFLDAWPDVDLDVIQKFQFGGIDALYGHDIDILVTPDPLDQRELLFEPVFDYEQVLVVPVGVGSGWSPAIARGIAAFARCQACSALLGPQWACATLRSGRWGSV